MQVLDDQISSISPRILTTTLNTISQPVSKRKKKKMHAYQNYLLSSYRLWVIWMFHWSSLIVRYLGKIEHYSLHEESTTRDPNKTKWRADVKCFEMSIKSILNGFLLQMWTLRSSVDEMISYVCARQIVPFNLGECWQNIYLDFKEFTTINTQ